MNFLDTERSENRVGFRTISYYFYFFIFVCRPFLAQKKSNRSFEEKNFISRWDIYPSWYILYKEHF